MSVFLKDPDAVEPYTFDWSNELASGETISSSIWAVLPTGELTVDSDSETTTTASVVISGGNAGSVYRLTNAIVTNQNQNPQHRSLTVRIAER